MKYIQVIIALAVIVVAWALPGIAQPPESKPIAHKLGATERQLSRAGNEFGFRLFQEINNTGNETNLCISPMSVSLALAMVYNGANGATKTAMENTLGFSGMSTEQINISQGMLLDYFQELDSAVQLEIANSIWYRNSFSVKDEFVKVNEEYYDAEVTGLEFNNQAPKIINNWVNEKTQGLIPEIITDIPPLLRMILINAIYFKGSWTHPFDEDDTQEEQFYLTEDSVTLCPMMFLDRRFSYHANEIFQVIDVPYGQKDYSMTVFLPVPEISVDSLIGLIDRNSWNNWTKRLANAEGMLYLPRFKFAYSATLNPYLSALGMDICFSTQNADFSGISDEYLYINEVIHKAFIETNEEGTEAAAVTSVGMKTLSITPLSPKFTMRVDRPFLFAIRERQSGAILFLGKVVDPTLD